MYTQPTRILVSALIVSLSLMADVQAGPRDGGSLRFAASARNIDRPANRDPIQQRSERVQPGEHRDEARKDRRDDRQDRRDDHQDDRQDRRDDHQDDRQDRRDDRREARWEYRWDHYWYHHTYSTHVYFAPGYAVVELPESCIVVKADGLSYYYCDGTYYRASGTRFVVVTAPHGVHLHSLPHGHYRVAVHHHNYHVYAGTYYVWEPQLRTYKVVKAPEGVILPSLPEGAEQVTIRGQRYYKVAGVHYQPLFDGIQLVYRSTAV